MKICIVGTGYVGLVAAACFAEMGNEAACVDVNEDVIARLKKGEIHIFEPGLAPLVQRNLAEGRLMFTTDLAEGLREALFVFNCVGTPPNPDGSCGLHFLDAAAAQVGRCMTDYKVVINKSTVPVGTADRVKAIIAEALAARGLDLPFDVVSNPEFLKEGDAVNDFMKPDRVIIGADNPRAAALLADLYAPFARSRDKLILMTVRSAEMTKYAANCMLAAKISFINEMAAICEAIGADIKEVRAGIGADHRIGHHFIYPGLGYGGSCFPKDVNALIHTAKTHHCDPELLTAVDRVNTRQKLALVRKMEAYFGSRGGLGDKVAAVWGLSFKANTDDIRESAALVMIDELTSLGMRVRAYDPAAGENARRALAANPRVAIGDSQYGILEGADALVAATDWNQFRNPDFTAIRKALAEPVIFDGRNLYSPSRLAELGFRYFCIGRPTVG